jgi:release factor glutamine methyltransferase
MDTVKHLFDTFKHTLNGIYDANEIEALTLLAVTEITGSAKSKIKAFPEQALTPQQSGTLAAMLSRLKTGEPLQYILGHTEFYGLPFKVNPSVLIPRPETEELVEWALDSSQLAVGNVQSAVSILDIGTGSGCIAISLKKNLPTATVTAIDISPAALQTAKENAKLNNVDINFIEADILNPKKFEIENPTFEIIISNPPYVTLADKKQMHTNVTDFEPHGALFVPESDPLIFYKAIADFAKDNLTPGGLLFFEINENLGKETVDLLSNRGFVDIELRKDISGRDRMARGTWI